ncbi:MAG: TMEM165/GDT1 family protein [Sphingopyxis sp.]|nr:TMEM165/GDT1 family protein [Sphingopyxis sp.]
MIALVAVLLANADGQSGITLSRLLSARADRRVTTAIVFAAFAVNAAVAAIAGQVANRMIGQGVVALLVAAALLSAAAALVWRMKPARDDAGRANESPPMLAGRMLIAQFGDRSHFLIGALAATSAAGQWAMAGGIVGWTLAMLPFLAFGPALAERRAARVLRWISAAILMLWALRTGLGAFGLIG